MIVVKTLEELREVLREKREAGLSIGFVPTMGALHAGHISLVRQCVADNAVSVVSIFVNPTQFNDPVDLINYPRTLEADVLLLEPEGVDVVFAPSVEEVYPEEDTRVFDFGMLDKAMEGVHRPGHFNGVAQVVSRLFRMVEPTRAYFGEKDFQQLAIIRNMVQQLDLSVEIVSMPIVRESSGLAMSSRNALLSQEQCDVASHIYQVLKWSKQVSSQYGVEELAVKVKKEIEKYAPLKVEYFEIADATSLLPIKSWSDSPYIVGCVAVFCDKVRLIDNIIYQEKIP